LLYVAMTRAKDNLHLIVPQRFFAHSQRSNGDRHMYASRTRFIPAEILKFFFVCTWPIAFASAYSTIVRACSGRRRREVAAYVEWIGLVEPEPTPTRTKKDCFRHHAQ